MAYTGGELNSLNGEFGISAPKKSVPIMKLIRIHKPKSKDELYNLIKFHYEENCLCGVKSQGTIEDFGKKLYNAQFVKWKKAKYTLKQCIQWEYDLFITQSLKGTRVEKNAKEILQSKLKNFQIIDTVGFVDEELRIDLIIIKHEKEICGIQIKPETYNYMKESIKKFNIDANTKWGKPVLYLFYDKYEKFTNINKIINFCHLSKKN